MIFPRCTLCRRRLWFGGEDLTFAKHHDRWSTARTFPFCERCVDFRMGEIVEWWDKESA